MFSNEVVSIAVGAFHFKLESFVRTRILQSLQSDPALVVEVLRPYKTAVLRRW